jgi:hypothetical protein
MRSSPVSAADSGKYGSFLTFFPFFFNRKVKSKLLSFYYYTLYHCKSKVAAIKKCKIATRPHPEEKSGGHREIKQKGECIMSAEWGFGEWFFLIWAVCYLITFLIFIKADKNVEHWLGYSIVCVYFWPLMWIYWICSSLGDD